MPSSCCASSANSIGSSLNTSRQNPDTIIDTACSAREPALLQVEDLVLADLRRRRLVLDRRRVVADLDVRERVRAAAVADEHRVALRVVARARRLRQHLHAAAIRVVALARRDSLRDDRSTSCCCRCGSSSCPCPPAACCSRRPRSRTRRPTSSPWRITLGYFHVIADPVSTCVHEIFDFRPDALPRFVTKL